MNNQVEFVCLWCCVPPDFVVQINNFFSLVVFFLVIHKRRGKNLISKAIKYKLDSSSKMTIDLVENLEITQGGGRIMFFALL